MQLVAVQLDTRWHDKRANHEKVRALLGETAIEPGAMIVLGEMFATGFSLEVDTIAENDTHETAAFLAELAREHRATVVGGAVTRDKNTGKGRNEALVFDAEGDEIARYCKMHPVSFLGELDCYVKGDRVVTFGWGDAKVSPLICYDLRFPEAFRIAVRGGTEVLVVIASWPAKRHAHWLNLAVARAIENQCYVVAVNRTGDDPNHTHVGGTRIIDFRGDVLADAGSNERVITAKADLAALRAYRQEVPVLTDMRDDLK
ncbi:MAG: carbon-nitrogen family hydrolase [Phycisphaera sp.]|nr:carbon-nitrogen family hydrolase [Phycisphaera sp.]